MKSKQLNRNEIESLPKVELHLHLDCCLSFDVVSMLRPGTTWEDYQEDFIGAAKYKDLANFLKIIDNSLELMQSEEGLRLVTEDLFQQLKKDNVIYTEIRFSPLLHLQQGLTPEDVVRIVEETVSRSVEETGVEARVILCTLRHYTKEQSMTTVQLVEKFQGSRVAALDIGADEAGFPIDAHISAFRYARERGIPCTAHAGEARGPESVWETLEHFKPTRIGHGVRSIEDPQLLEELKKKNIHLEVCPTCNIQIDVFDTYTDHPIAGLYNAGVSVGINTDTRTITNISLSDEYEKLHQVFGWSIEHFLQCNRGALAAAFLLEPQKQALEKKLMTND
ncbi:MAG: adenosine deaminase [Candidatus Aminicenantes bacterium]|nr:adenosine deaminase [Candidatus Aminicenantes bacterium]NIM77961.1 adenosine deaminase [Candidatus Aminicenantes bacterium]NIN17290.1 adenosine deaminase [Candidatus Aminicenantes bacterium]NIN41181.1 adenosine deaminase [Candidatus Aminicenantes bacterium]NIN83958.1 adenosine deaminase [Candidatus Aminicenantes bacterium]